MNNDTLQQLSDKYWGRAQTTYLAAPEYYDRQEKALRDMLGKLTLPPEGLDIGCGDGRYTIVAAEMGVRMLGLDLSNGLIERARERRAESGVSPDRCDFEIGRAENLPADTAFDLVLCMGVTSALIDDAAFESALRGIRTVCRDGGALVMKDTVSLEKDRIAQTDAYVARYRLKSDYLDAIQAHGFAKQKEIYLIEPDGRHSNSMMLFTKTG